ncbi:MAG TPA: TIGR03086 family metal-binding protein [Acidimicrobiia bacterium]
MKSWHDARARHGAALAGFTRTAHGVPEAAWQLPTPCTAWNAHQLVEHVIGFHEFLLLRPLGVRAHRPRVGPLERWLATEGAIRLLLDERGALDADVPYFDGEARRPADVLDALADDVLVHTWDLARAARLPDRLDPDACAVALAHAQRDGRPGNDLFGSPVEVPDEAPTQDRLLGLLGRDPRWPVPPGGPVA